MKRINLTIGVPEGHDYLEGPAGFICECGWMTEVGDDAALEWLGHALNAKLKDDFLESVEGHWSARGQVWLERLSQVAAIAFAVMFGLLLLFALITK